jgi:hypothetical protein
MAKLKEPKLFNLKEARETLPFVKRIVADIIDAQEKLAKLNREIQFTSNLAERRRKLYHKELLKRRLEECQKEMDLVGCHLKNTSLGIIGYYWDPTGDGFVVELCWRYGEEDIYYWQEIGHDELHPLHKLPYPPEQQMNNKGS